MFFVLVLFVGVVLVAIMSIIPRAWGEANVCSKESFDWSVSYQNFVFF